MMTTIKVTTTRWYYASSPSKNWYGGRYRTPHHLHHTCWYHICFWYVPGEEVWGEGGWLRINNNKYISSLVDNGGCLVSCFTLFIILCIFLSLFLCLCIHICCRLLLLLWLLFRQRRQQRKGRRRGGGGGVILHYSCSLPTRGIVFPLILILRESVLSLEALLSEMTIKMARPWEELLFRRRERKYRKRLLCQVHWHQGG